MTQAEQSLVERWVLHRDADAFARIVAEHSAMVYSTCLRLLRSAADAEDVAQECFLALASGRTRVRVSLGAWLHTLATRRSLDKIRSTRRREQRERRSAESTAPHQTIGWNDVQEYVDEAIAGLPAKYQSVLVAHFLEGQSFEALGSKLALPRSTVASRVQRAIELVRADLRKRGVPVQPSVLAAVLAAPIGQELPRGLALALGKMAIAGAGASPGGAVAGASPGAAVAAGAEVLTGGTILMAKKVVAVSIVGLALAAEGGVEGVVVDPSGAPPIQITATGNIPVAPQNTTTDANGSFALIRGFPAGPYLEFAVASSARGFIEQGVAAGAEVTAGAVANVGTVILLPAPQNPQAPPNK